MEKNLVAFICRILQSVLMCDTKTRIVKSRNPFSSQDVRGAFVKYLSWPFLQWRMVRKFFNPPSHKFQPGIYTAHLNSVALSKKWEFIKYNFTENNSEDKHFRKRVLPFVQHGNYVLIIKTNFKNISHLLLLVRFS